MQSINTTPGGIRPPSHALLLKGPRDPVLEPPTPPPPPSSSTPWTQSMPLSRHRRISSRRSSMRGWPQSSKKPPQSSPRSSEDRWA
eukprot:2644808-Pyramimonas_sp.AAC.1